jgi:hypothetical protein
MCFLAMGIPVFYFEGVEMLKQKSIGQNLAGIQSWVFQSICSRRICAVKSN